MAVDYWGVRGIANMGIFKRAASEIASTAEIGFRLRARRKVAPPFYPRVGAFSPPLNLEFPPLPPRPGWR